ncbi:hypothetical protein PNEG_00086 [Pneumocystis murina B123]|uniref:Endoplasmic reticulum lectin n=1 Tax=Pneumocystis murina (strain B123) TaxID=1069680 RepID=M7NSB9_PNEMU|nr:hypothetical protein PNEG_00086 [Pneumocystis murina B123]EMR11648.1 hypothetical protein PNEG_00086 [Pneumocystis murina B123]
MKKNIILWIILPFIHIYGFSVYDDILSQPRYQINFKKMPISRGIVNDRLLTDNRTHKDDIEYEILKLKNEEYLCTIPKVNDELIENEETPEEKIKKEQEADKALEKGLKLLSSMENTCIYYLEGWWTYVFCYNKYAKQFHQKEWDGTQRGLRMLENQSENYYFLGKLNATTKKKEPELPSKIEYNGDSYYISQRMHGGTYCNLIQDNRHIEIQYICEPDTYDKIMFISEVSTCSYKMIVHTSKLCKESFFNQINNKNVHIVSCEKILNNNEYAELMNVLYPKTPNNLRLDLFFSNLNVKHIAKQKRKKRIEKNRNTFNSSYIYKNEN